MIISVDAEKLTKIQHPFMIKKEKPSTKYRYKANIPQYMTGLHLTSYCGEKFKALYDQEQDKTVHYCPLFCSTEY